MSSGLYINYLISYPKHAKKLKTSRFIMCILFFICHFIFKFCHQDKRGVNRNQRNVLLKTALEKRLLFLKKKKKNWKTNSIT